MELPDWFDLEVQEEGDIVTNPFTGESIELNNKELSMYDFIMGCKITGQYDYMKRGLEWFEKANPKAFKVLLD